MVSVREADHHSADATVSSDTTLQFRCCLHKGIAIIPLDAVLLLLDALLLLLDVLLL